MKDLVLRKDVVTLKDTTEQLQSDLNIDLHEAADIVLGVLREHGPSIQFWVIPSRGLPYKDDEPSQKRQWSSEWLESKWWDKDHQQRQNELREMSGSKSFQDDFKIEDMGVLRKDAYRLFLSDALDMLADRCTTEPKDKLVSITKLLSSISDLSGGRAEIPELSRAFSDIYDADRTMIYISGNWLCEPINGGVAGHNKRADISCDFVNSYGNPRLDGYLILKDDAVQIARKLWMMFFNEPWIDPYEDLRLGYPVSKSLLKASTGSNIATGVDQTHLPGYLDPNHPRYAPKLAAAVNAWLAMEDESLRRGKKPLSAMTAWLAPRYEEFGLTHKQSGKNGKGEVTHKIGDRNDGAITQVAQVANWEFEGGAPKTPG